jgi:hypothetical protein
VRGELKLPKGGGRLFAPDNALGRLALRPQLC